MYEISHPAPTTTTKPAAAPVRDEPTRAAEFPRNTEQFVCPSDDCGATIPQSHVLTVWPQHLGRVSRHVTAVCPGCRAVWIADLVLSGAVWIVDGAGVRQATEAQARSARRRVEEKNDVAFAQSA